MLEKSSLKKIVGILSGISLLLLAGVGIMLWLLFSKQTEFMQSAQNSSSKEEDELLRIQYKTLVDRTRDRRALLETYVVRGDADTAHLLETIENLAKVQALETSQNVTIEKVSSSVRALAITLEVRGEFTRVMSFLAGLEALPHEITFRDVSLRRSSELSSTTKAQWTLNVGMLVKSFQP